MLEAARSEHPEAEIVVKTHPDVISGKKRGHLTDLAARGRVRLLTEPCNPAALLDEVDRVYVMTSLLGFEALMADKPVTCFGVPFYAGWGLTDDRGSIPGRRGRPRSLEELFAAAYLLYARYVDPETGERCEAERVIEHLALQRRVGERNAKTMVCVGFSAWKRGFVSSFVRGPGNRVRFAKSARDAERKLDEDAALLAWGTKDDASLQRLSKRRGVPLWRMEDGFLRSVGLGSDLFAPASLVVDRQGIYYDPTRPSELERTLSEARFTDEELTRAKALRERIVATGISKYNVGVKRRVGPPPDDERDVVLVVGQVEDDASIQLGCLDVRRNEDLLRATRLARPHAYVLYKPHPDVVSGNRADSLALQTAERLCDEVVVDASLADCLAVADEVHTMTSLVGFEALLRDKHVEVYGQPFYAGWGLTKDRHPHPRRTRRLTLDELVAGALLRYPRYVHPVTGRYTTPERVVELLRSAPRPSAWETTWPGRQLRKLVNLVPATSGLRRPPSTSTRVRPKKPSPLPDFGVTNALLLQGPAGPFMRRFAEELEDAGIRATKVNFHAGDVFWFPGPKAVSYRGKPEDFGGWVDQLMEDLGIDGIFLFGDCRRHHRAAIEAAERRGARVWVFEEGYLRPDWITLEEHGVNGYSRMPKDPDFYRSLNLPEPPPPEPVGQVFHLMAWYSTFSALSFTHLNDGFRHYEHHRDLNAWHHTAAWLRGLGRKKRFQLAERHLMARFEGELSGRYFFVPLQVHNDFQIVHSPYDDFWQFVREVAETFATHADPEHHIVFKHHPMDRPFREHGADFAALALELGLGDRLHYCHDLHLPTLLKHAKGTITCNSTVGLSSIHHQTPVKVMGTAVYDMPGLTHHGSLASFLRARNLPNARLYEQFRRYLIYENQVNGSFYKRLPGLQTGTGVRWFATRRPNRD
jgi:capsular polysaccharide export protein